MKLQGDISMSISKTSLLWFISFLLAVIVCLVFEITDRDAKIASLEKEVATAYFDGSVDGLFSNEK